MCVNYPLCIIMEKNKSTVKDQLCKEIGVAMKVSKVKSRIEARKRVRDIPSRPRRIGGVESPRAQTEVASEHEPRGPGMGKLVLPFWFPVPTSSPGPLYFHCPFP